MKFDFKESMKLFWKALGALGLPVLILGGIYGGIFTPTESAAVGIVYALILGFALKELKVKRFTEDPDQFPENIDNGQFHHRGGVPVLLGCIEIPDRNRDFQCIYQLRRWQPGTLSLRTSCSALNCRLFDG